jgi:hypothetical protein
VTSTPPGEEAKYTQPFTLDARGLDELPRKLAEDGLFRTEWRESAEGLPSGSGSMSLEVRAGGRDLRCQLPALATAASDSSTRSRCAGEGHRKMVACRVDTP